MSKQSRSHPIFRFATVVAIFAAALASLVLLVRKNIFVFEIVEATFDYLQDFREYNNFHNPFLAENFFPVGEENINLQLQLISGSIPSDLEGLFLRNGPNPIPEHIRSGTKRYHWFDGHGMLHSVRVKNGQALYSNQWIRTPRYLKDREVNRTFFENVGELYGILGFLKILITINSKFDLYGYNRLQTRQANTAILLHNNKLYATLESSLPFEIKWRENNSFTSIGYETFGNKLDFPFTAHPKVEVSDNSLYFFGYDVGATDGSYMKYGSVNKKSSLQSYFKVNSYLPTFSHDCFLSNNHIILIESSVVFAPEGIMRGEFFYFNQSHHLRLGVVPKNASSETKTQWFVAEEPLVIVHTLNAWEEVSTTDPTAIEIVLWAPVTRTWDASLTKNSNIFHMTEIRLNLKTGLMSVNTIDKTFNVEFPRMHPNYIGRKARYGFSGILERDGIFSGLVKFDLEAKKLVSYFRYCEGCLSSEMVPAVKAGAAGEASDGLYMTTFVYNPATNTSEWVVYDGTSMSSEPLVRMAVPKRVPFGFHGEWIPESSLLSHMAA